MPQPQSPPASVAQGHGDGSARGIGMALTPGTLLAGVAGGIAFPILPIAGVKLGLSLTFIGMILAANRAMRIVSSPTVGVFADRVGGRRTLLFGLMLQILVMAAFATGIVTHHAGAFFLGGRLLHGPASACVFVSAQALALHGGGQAHGGRATGAVRASIVLGVPIGVVAGGLLSDRFGDATTFVIAGFAVAAALLAAWITVPDLRATPVGARPPLRETLKLFADRRLFTLGALNLALSFSGGGMVLTTLALLVHERHLTVLGRNEQGTAGLLIGWMTVVDAVLTPIAGRIGDRRHAHGRVAAAALLSLIVGLVLIAFAGGVRGIALGLALVGAGGAGLGPSLLVLMGRAVPAGRRATGAGLLQLCGDVGGTLGPLVGTALLADHTAAPYCAAAALLVCAVPLAIRLAREETALVASPEGPP
jgi:MFS family permease